MEQTPALSGGCFFQGGIEMAIDTNLLSLIQNPNQLYSGKGRFINNQLNPLNKQSTNSNAVTNQQVSKNFNVNLSAEGLDALQNQTQTDDIDTSIFATNKELSPKAQAFLDKLQEQYGDKYDFFVADNFDDPQALTAGSTKQYSVIFSSDELEKMANDEEYATSMLGKVDDAVKSFDEIIEKANLDGKAQFSKLAISFDNEGNSKIFATLEKLSESQQKRLEAAKARAEESGEFEETTATKTAETEEKVAEQEEQPATFSITAENKESLLEQLYNVNWDKVFVS